VLLHDSECHDVEYSARFVVLRIGEGVVKLPVSICSLPRRAARPRTIRNLLIHNYFFPV
jgi:hypothetical protein